mmetsp:Transcript_34275/g.82977  ORF Transcript_34275/g.82977 Transcript_34275/m.82977 type:complete len:193 (+) Transcript_34275:214-792(+)
MSAEKPKHPFFFVRYGPDERSRVMFNSGCRCHILLDTIKEQCISHLDRAIRKRLGEIYEEVKQIKKNIRKLEVQKISQSRRGSMDTTRQNDENKEGDVKNESLAKIEASLEAEKEEEKKRQEEEKRLNTDLQTVQTLDKIDIASQDGKPIELRKNREVYAFTILTANDTYKLLKIEVDENGGETEITIEVNV